MYKKKASKVTINELSKLIKDLTILGNPFELEGICTYDELINSCLTYLDAPALNIIEDKLAKDQKLAIFISSKVDEQEIHSFLDKYPDTCFLLTQDPKLAFVKSGSLFYSKRSYLPGVHPTAIIDETANIGESVHIGAYSVVGANTTIGDGCVIHSNVKIYEDVTVGANCEFHSFVSIHSGSRLGNQIVLGSSAVIGSEGFGFVPDKEVGLRKFIQTGNVILEDGVEVGANSSIDRGAVGDTYIGMGTKIDNNVQIGHNNKIGKFCIICGCVAMGGSCKIGDGVVIGGRVGVADHVEIVSGARVGGGGGVAGNILEPGDYLGAPAIKAKDWRRIQVIIMKLPQMYKKLLKIKF